MPQSYILTGSNLTEAIVISVPSGIEISTSCGSGYTNSISFSPSAGNINTTIYARYLGGAVNGNITHTHSGAATINITISETSNESNLPGTYYSTATGTDATLKTQLYNIIKGHTARTYTNLWTDFQTTDRKPDGSVWDMYTDIPCGSSCVMTYTTNQDNGTGGTAECQKYNREHSWPNSWFGGDVAANEASIAYTDLFHLIPTDKYVNNARGNYIIGEVTLPTKTFTNGGLIGPNNVSGSGYTGTVFEPIDEYKGDFARAYFYMVTRYQPDQAAWESLTSEGDVIMDGTIYPSLEPWVLTMLINWNNLDPVDQKEKSRNDAIYTIQGNRNPFIDNPNFVNLVWISSPTLSSSSSFLSGFTYTQGSGPSTNQNFTISGSNLTGSGNITATGSTNYEVSSDGTNFASSVTFPFASGVITSQPKTVYVRLKSSLSAGNYNTENITISGGSATSINVVCSGAVSAVSSSCANDLIISEYVEGTSNNKYIELYNGTNTTIDLSNYRLRLFSNGSTTATNDVILSGSIASRETVVYRNSAAIVYSETSSINTTCSFNGDDAIALFKISTSSYVDILGKIGEDPGTEWISGSISTLNKSIVRKSTIFQGVATNPASGFPTLATEWDVYNTDDVSHLGSHNMACPSIITAGTITSFGSYSLNTPSAEQTYTISGNNLLSNIVITPPVNFEISTTSGSNFITSPSSIVLSPAKGNISPHTIYVRMRPTIIGSISGNIENSSSNASSVIIPLSGEGIDVSTMPVELINFIGTCDQKGQTKIDWTTATESNNSHFILEKSVNGKNWQQISKISGAGNSSVSINYSSIDQNSIHSQLIRLIQVDYDGNSTIYGPIAIYCNNTNKTEISIHPNPFNHQLTLHIMGIEDSYQISLIDISGKLIFEDRSVENETYILNTANLAPGVYMLKFTSKEKTEHFKVVKN